MAAKASPSSIASSTCSVVCRIPAPAWAAAQLALRDKEARKQMQESLDKAALEIYTKYKT